MSKDQILVIVESPKKAKTIVSYLGQNYTVRSTYGHISDLVKGGKDGIGIDIENGFTPKYAVLPDKKDKVKTIIDAAKTSKYIYIASDPDREGEAIAWHVYQQLKGIKAEIKRVEFHEITKSGVQKAIASPRDLNIDLFDAQQARRVLDRIVGFMASPYLINRLGAKLSAGRVQSVALKLIVDREREIEAFVPEEYWNVTAALAKLKDKTNSFEAKYTKKISDEKTAKKIKSDLESSDFIVDKIVKSEQKRNPPPPFTTSRLQQVAASRFKFSADRTMKAAQNLYESGVVTYIRTDSVRCAPEALTMVRSWLKDNSFDVPAPPNMYKVKNAAQDAHEAIRPTDVSKLPKDTSDDDGKLYKLIWEYFVASQMNPAVFDTMAVTIKAGQHELKANGRALKYPGWLAVTQDVDNNEKDVILPPLKEGEDLVLVPPKVKAEKKQTQPPPRYNDGSIIKELEKREIGRPSTYATIIGKLSNRNYVIKSKNQFTPTDMGRQVVDALAAHFTFMSYDYTKDMEDKLDKIADGTANYLSTLTDFYSVFKNELKSAYTSTQKDGGHDCDKCGKRMILKHSRYGFFISCSGYPECKNIKGVVLEGDKIILNEKHKVVDGVTCPECNSGMVRRDGQFGPFYSCSTYPKCYGKRRIPFGKKCSDCGSELFMTAFKGDPKLACMGYPNCKHVEDIPPGTNVNWLNPKTLEPKEKKKTKKVEKIINR